MVPKSNRSEPPPACDEDWWAALLAEESKQTQQKVTHAVSAPFTSKAVEREKIGEHRISRSVSIDWAEAQHLYDQDETVNLPVTGHNRGGVLVCQDGLQGFVPISHLLQITCQTDDDERNEILSGYVGQHITLKVIECDPDRGRIVFSERAALAGSGRRNQLLDDIQVGEQVCGYVTNITDFGIFLDLGGVEGLIHVSELSWGRVRHPGDMAEVGDKLNAIVLQVEKERARIALSLKRMRQNPWETAAERYEPGQIVEAVITSIVPFGAFARLEEGLDGLIHATEFVTSGHILETSPDLKEGQVVQVRILNVDASRQRLGLSLKLNYEPVG